MALYTFECNECGTQVDLTFKISEKPKSIAQTCLVCKKATEYRHVITRTGLVFTGQWDGQDIKRKSR